MVIAKPEHSTQVLIQDVNTRTDLDGILSNFDNIFVLIVGRKPITAYGQLAENG